MNCVSDLMQARSHTSAVSDRDWCLKILWSFSIPLKKKNLFILEGLWGTEAIPADDGQNWILDTSAVNQGLR